MPILVTQTSLQFATKTARPCPAIVAHKHSANLIHSNKLGFGSTELLKPRPYCNLTAVLDGVLQSAAQRRLQTPHFSNGFHTDLIAIFATVSILRPVLFECVAAMSHRGIILFVLNPSGSNPSVPSDAYLISVLGWRSCLLCRRRSVRCGAHSDALGPFKRRQVSTTIPRTVAIIAVPLSIHKL